MQLPAANYDILILGAGINGCGIAAELTRFGKRVLVLERNAIGSGTSSKSSRLIHGGLRYLETAQFGLVREALQDRRELLEEYPELVELKPFYLPVYASSPRPAWMIRTGLGLYDLLSGKYADRRSERITVDEFLSHAPNLRAEELKAAFRYYDGKTDDLELTRQIAAAAHRLGCRFHEHIKLETITRQSDSHQIRTNRGIFTAPILINATGPWIDEVNARYSLPADFHIRKISGIHIVIDGLLVPDLMFMQTKNQRIFFIIPEPEYDRTIIGTTEREETVPCDEVTYSDSDIEYLLENINSYLMVERQLTISDVQDVWIGIRPLIAHRDNPTNLSREYALDLHRIDGTILLHVFGGKLTTFRSLARKVVKLLKI
ncbi:MAG: glycerol-3-phosphate dehydrogenase/oxidase, partial [Candidatus Neomarinimicrobiota bacterium]